MYPYLYNNVVGFKGVYLPYFQCFGSESRIFYNTDPDTGKKNTFLIANNKNILGTFIFNQKSVLPYLFYKTGNLSMVEFLKIR